MEYAGIVEISRPPRHMAKFRSFSIFLDGVKAERIKEGETKTLSTSPGIHTLWLKIDWVHSNHIQVDVMPNETIHLVVKRSRNSGLKYWGTLVAFGLMLTFGATLGEIFLPIFVIAAGLCMGQLWRPELEEMRGPS